MKSKVILKQQVYLDGIYEEWDIERTRVNEHKKMIKEIKI